MATSVISSSGRSLPSHFEGIGYTRSRNGIPLEAFRAPVPRPAGDEVLIHVYHSSINPLDYKLAQLNFLGRTPPVVLGFDLSGVVVDVGADVKAFAVGDEVMAMADSNKDGGWAVYGNGGYALAREYLTVKKPASLSFHDAAALPLCFLAAYCGLYPYLQPGATVYIPGGAGGVGHLAVQMAAHALAASRVISSGSKPETIALARQFGADHVFNYRTDDTVAEVAKVTGGQGVDLVFDATYSEAGFVESAKAVKAGGKWVVLGVGPGKTSRAAETASPVDSILSSRNAEHVNANLLTFFSHEASQTAKMKTFLSTGMRLAALWLVEGKVKPFIGKSINASLEEINRELIASSDGRGVPGKVVVKLVP